MGNIHDDGEAKRFQQAFGNRECAFQIEDDDKIKRLLGSGVSGYGGDDMICLCRKKICPFFQMWRGSKE